MGQVGRAHDRTQVKIGPSVDFHPRDIHPVVPMASRAPFGLEQRSTQHGRGRPGRRRGCRAGPSGDGRAARLPDDERQSQQGQGHGQHGQRQLTHHLRLHLRPDGGAPAGLDEGQQRGQPGHAGGCQTQAAGG